MNKNTVSIYFSKDEYERAEKAIQHSVLGWNPLLKVFIKNGLDELGNGEKLTFVFDRCYGVDKKTYKTKVVRLDERSYEEMVRICSCTPFSMSNLAKYFIMPQIDEMIEKKGWNYRP